MKHRGRTRPRPHWTVLDALHALLVRAGWLPELGHGRVPCRDHSGQRASVLILSTRAGVVLVASKPGPLLLERLDAGRLRGALRTAALLPDPAVRMPRGELIDDEVWTVAA